MNDHPTVQGEGVGKPVKPGQDIAVVATFHDDIPANLMPSAGFEREDGPDSSGRPWNFGLTNSVTTGPRTMRIHGILPDVAPGKYRLSALMLMLLGATQRVSDPDGDCVFVVEGGEGPQFPRLADIDPV